MDQELNMSENMTKKQWVEKYAKRIMNYWRKLDSAFDIDNNFSRHISQDLEQAFDDPLRRQLIEASY